MGYNSGMNEWDKTTDKVLQALETNRATPVSGAALAKEAGVSRNAVWKAVNALIARGDSEISRQRIIGGMQYRRAQNGKLH